MLDMEEGKWTHFNSLYIKGVDSYYQHVKCMMNYVDKKMAERYVKALEDESLNVEVRPSQITKPKRENYKDAPQQPTESVDCGICMLVVLEKVMEGKMKEEIKGLFKFTKEEVARYITRMVQTFLRLGEEHVKAR